jgi:hypothetical protein
MARIEVPILYDAEGTFVRAYGAKIGMAWPVRPDGYIGLCLAKLDRAALKRFVQRAFAKGATTL